jgi:hypothetical protein
LNLTSSSGLMFVKHVMVLEDFFVMDPGLLKCPYILGLFDFRVVIENSIMRPSLEYTPWSQCSGILFVSPFKEKLLEHVNG